MSSFYIWYGWDKVCKGRLTIPYPSVSRSVNQPDSQSVSQPDSKLGSQTVRQAARQTVRQPDSQAVSQWNNQNFCVSQYTKVQTKKVFVSEFDKHHKSQGWRYKEKDLEIYRKISLIYM